MWPYDNTSLNWYSFWGYESVRRQILLGFHVLEKSIWSDIHSLNRMITLESKNVCNQRLLISMIKWNSNLTNIVFVVKIWSHTTYPKSISIIKTTDYVQSHHINQQVKDKLTRIDQAHQLSAIRLSIRNSRDEYSHEMTTFISRSSMKISPICKASWCLRQRGMCFFWRLPCKASRIFTSLADLTLCFPPAFSICLIWCISTFRSRHPFTAHRSIKSFFCTSRANSISISSSGVVGSKSRMNLFLNPLISVGVRNAASVLPSFVMARLFVCLAMIWLELDLCFFAKV